MTNVTFITGNQRKADYLAKYLGWPVAHRKVDVDELQSLDLHEIVEHKVKQAYELVKTPVIVEDVGLEFAALGRLPGPFIKWFLEALGPQKICALLEGKDRTAVARCVYGYYDGATLKMFEGALNGRIAETPSGGGGFGWDSIFVPEGYKTTRAELSEADYQKVYLKLRPFVALKSFLEKLPRTG